MSSSDAKFEAWSVYFQLNIRHNWSWTAGVADDVNKNHMKCHVTVALQFEMLFPVNV